MLSADSISFVPKDDTNAQVFGLSLVYRFGPVFCSCSLAMGQNLFSLVHAQGASQRVGVYVGEAHGALGQLQ